MNTTEKSTINLGGNDFVITCLPFAANRVVIPAADFAWKALKRSKEEHEPMSVTAVDNTYLAVFTAVNHCYPDMTREKFNALNLDLNELLVALAAVCIQTGVLQPAKKDGNSTNEAPKTGEA